MRSFFYFCKVYDEVMRVQYELDSMYDDLLYHFNHYIKSVWNDPMKSEYDCMVKYMQDNRAGIISYSKPKK
jgi:hypothetical protein